MNKARNASATGLRTSVRLSLQFSFLYAVLSALVFAMGYVFTRYVVQDWVLDQMRGDARTLRAIFDDGGTERLIASIDALAEVSFENARIYQLAAADGTLLSGNIVEPMHAPLPAAIPANEISLSSNIHAEVERYWMRETTIGPYRLIQGSGDNIVAETLEALGAALFLGYIAVVGLGLLFGVSVGRITEARIAAILNTLSRVSRGELAARVPITSAGADDLARVSSQINEMLDQINRLLEAQQQISNDIAHDMRTPLQHLHQRLERMNESDTILKEDVQAGLQQTQEIIATFNALLRISQLEADDRQARFERTSLAQILSNVAEVFEPVAEDNGIALTTATANGDQSVWGDPGLLTQMFANIIENAVKHCPSGTTIQVSSDSDSENVIACIADNGPGIDPADRERIFRRFFRGETSRQGAGNGLGLAMVKAIADLHGATVSVADNKPGSLFKIRFTRPGPAGSG